MLLSDSLRATVANKVARETSKFKIVWGLQLICGPIEKQRGSDVGCVENGER